LEIVERGKLLWRARKKTKDKREKMLERGERKAQKNKQKGNTMIMRLRRM
jgi:hypothetical protein